MITFTEDYRAKFAHKVMAEGALIKRIPRSDLRDALSVVAVEGHRMGRILQVEFRHDSACPCTDEGLSKLGRCLCERLSIMVSKGIPLASLSKEQ